MRYLLFLLILLPFFSLSNNFTFETWPSNSNTCTLGFDNHPTKNWDAVSKPPLSIKEVSLIFHNWASTNLTASEKGHAVSFNLASVSVKGLKESYWLYKVGYVVFNKNIPSNNFNRKLAIDLSGNIILPKCGL